MVDRFFLALDYRNEQEAVEHGSSALSFLRSEFADSIKGRVGVKINADLLTRSNGTLREFSDQGYEIFGDLKLAHDPAMGESVVRHIMRGCTGTPFNYVTIFGGLGRTMLPEYQERLGNEMKLIAYTVHTKIDPVDVAGIYGTMNLDNVLLAMGGMASEAGFDAMVIDGRRLRNPEIQKLPIKKLVTGVRIRPEEQGDQSRMTLLDDLARMREHVDYVVISSQYLGKDRRSDLARYFARLLG